MLKEVVIRNRSHIQNPNSKEETFCCLKYNNPDFVLSAPSIESINKGQVCKECLKKAKKFEYPEDELSR